MKGSGLKGVINADFLANLSAAARSQSKQSANPLKSGASSVSLSGTLRIGAQTYSGAVASLNNTISVVNISQATLERLGTITDKMMTLAERASQRGVGTQNRNELDIRFRRLVNQFKEVVSEAKLGDTDILSVDGLAEIFVRAGLDRDISKSIARVFDAFVTSEEDSLLASEEIKGKRPLNINPKAFVSSPSDASYAVNRISSSDVSDGAISGVNSVFLDTDTILNQNPGQNAIFTASSSGSITSQPAGTISSGLEFLAVDEESGYTLVKSLSDPFGHNTSGYEQIFAIGPDGEFVQQITNNTDPGSTYEGADLRRTNGEFRVVFISKDSGGAYSTGMIDIEDGADPSGVAQSDLSGGLSPQQYSTIKLSNDGESYAYGVEDVVTGQFWLEGANSLSSGATFDLDLTAATINDFIVPFGFSDSSTLLYGLEDPLILGKGSVWAYELGGPEPVEVSNGVYLGYFATIEAAEGSADHRYVVSDGSTSVMLYNGATMERELGLTAGDSITRLSLALNADGEHIDVGIVGALQSISGTPDQELYRWSFNPASVGGRAIGTASSEFESLFDSATNIRSRPAAYRVLNDLKALREQIDKNVEALDSAYEVIGQNLQLVRATGFAFLELSEQVRESDKAEDVASRLRRMIRADAGGALGAVENLENIAIAALALLRSEDSK